MNIILHHPLPLDHNAKSASGIRPLRMLEAFQALGYTVELVTGYASERKKAIENIKKQVRLGVQYDFVYAESSTMPNTLTDPHHLPLAPFLDWQFFRFCKNNNIPVGLFYRDIFWLFENYGKELHPIKAFAAKLAYRFDLWVYRKTLSRLYLPSMEMAHYIPSIAPSLCEALPPGYQTSEKSREFIPNFSVNPLKLFYVGGISDHYRMHELFEALRDLNNIKLTLCVRQPEWQSVRQEYEPLPANIKVVHLAGPEMESHLRACDMAVIFVEPQEYWQFASPVKLYEYLGFQKPILASEGTLTGQFVRQQGIGWTLPYECYAVRSLLDSLVRDPEQFRSVYDQLQKIAPDHTWLTRAQQVAGDLGQ